MAFGMRDWDGRRAIMSNERERKDSTHHARSFFLHFGVGVLCLKAERSMFIDLFTGGREGGREELSDSEGGEEHEREEAFVDMRSG